MESPILLDAAASAAALAMSERHFHEIRDEDWMPRPIQLGPRMLRWVRAELEAAALERMPRQNTRNEPAQLARARALRSSPEIA